MRTALVPLLLPLLVLVLATPSCVGTTGDQVVDFEAVASGPKATLVRGFTRLASDTDDRELTRGSAVFGPSHARLRRTSDELHLAG
jgi:hypothetical protein